jgi:hypothetical protein
MKIRAGFVSNSSSSSFVVGFNFKPESDYELNYMLFGQDAKDNWQNIDFHGIRYYTIGNIVWQSLQHQKPMTLREIYEEVRWGRFPGHNDGRNPYDYKTEKEKYEEYYHKQEIENKRCARKFLRKFFKSVPENMQFFTFTYSDNDGDIFSAMEHGGLFNRFPHIKINHH